MSFRYLYSTGPAVQPLRARPTNRSSGRWRDWLLPCLLLPLLCAGCATASSPEDSRTASAGKANVQGVSGSQSKPGLLVLQTDFGLQDHAVAAMRGVVRQVDRQLVLADLTHEVAAYDVWQASYRLHAVVDYWPADTVFVSVVDPGVGSQRKSVVALLKSGQMVVTPDNGTLTLLAEHPGVAQMREIDESVNRLGGSVHSHTFHGRDVYAYTGARLAAGVITFEEVGPLLAPMPRQLDYQRATLAAASVRGMVPVLDPRYGNVWTNIPRTLFLQTGAKLGSRVAVRVWRGDELQYTGTLPYVRTFSAVDLQQPLLYVNSLDQMALALNQGDFSAATGVRAGQDWRIELTVVPD